MRPATQHQRSHYRITLSGETDREGWRDAARRLLQHGIAPEAISWLVEGRQDGGELDLSPPASLPTAPSGARSRFPACTTTPPTRMS